MLKNIVDGNILVHAVKYVPSWFPGAGFKKQARIYEERARTLVQNQVSSQALNVPASNCRIERSQFMTVKNTRVSLLSWWSYLAQTHRSRQQELQSHALSLNS